MRDREAALQQLRQAASGMDWDAVPGAFFRLLYGLPATLQLDAARFPMRRYLRAFEERWPGITWPSHLLADTAAWLTQNHLALPDEPGETGPADAAFLEGCDALVVAVSRQEEPGVLTSSCVYCADRGIDAHFVAVWEQDDPEAVRLWAGQADLQGQDLASLLEGRTALDNEAARRTRRAEWLALVEFLDQQAVAAAPGVADVARMERDLQRWADQEYSLLLR
ncbi:hypothetical protein [Sorangium sp. So ce131]|uniref:hypothetical protein n=1 Tax=Sorangium sp. So ce131 TaxID=3133282 RepID=UPI003F6188CC